MSLTEQTSGTELVETSPSVRNIMLTIAYDGTNYRGWQVQPNGVTVQQRVEEAIERLTGTQTRVLCAGRTDTGVHALGQVASFKTLHQIPTANIRGGLQTHLPEDIVIVSAREVASSFHATFSAIRKRYRYLVFDADVCPPFLRNYVHRCKVRLNASAMHEAATHLLGTHDFRCFEKKYPNKLTSVRTIMDASVSRIAVWNPWQLPPSGFGEQNWPHEDESSPIIAFDVMADGFLYNMMRAIAGTLVDVGRGKRRSIFMREVIQSMERSTAGMTLPPCGLFLVQVDYPENLLHPESGLQ